MEKKGYERERRTAVFLDRSTVLGVTAKVTSKATTAFEAQTLSASYGLGALVGVPMRGARWGAGILKVADCSLTGAVTASTGVVGYSPQLHTG